MSTLPRPIRIDANGGTLDGVELARASCPGCSGAVSLSILNGQPAGVHLPDSKSDVQSVACDWFIRASLEDIIAATQGN